MSPLWNQTGRLKCPILLLTGIPPVWQYWCHILTISWFIDLDNFTQTSGCLPSARSCANIVKTMPGIRMKIQWAAKAVCWGGASGPKRKLGHVASHFTDRSRGYYVASEPPSSDVRRATEVERKARPLERAEGLSHLSTVDSLSSHLASRILQLFLFLDRSHLHLSRGPSPHLPTCPRAHGSLVVSPAMTEVLHVNVC